MSSQGHFGRALAGALALARFDRKGMEYFDLSYDGFWRSFNAIWVTLPIVIASAIVTPEVVRRLTELQPELASAAHTPQNIALFSVTESFSFVAGWLFFPVAMIWVARMLRIGGRYVPLIVAYNWSRVISVYAALMPAVLFGVGLLGAGGMLLLQFVAFIFILAYRWFVIRTATGLAGTTAFGLMLFELLGAFLVDAIAGQLYWLFEPGAAPPPGNT
jgi:hypothetical protein